MENSTIISASEPRILRNGKIITIEKNQRTKSLSTPSKKINNKLFFNKISLKDVSNLNVKNKTMVNSNYNNMIKIPNLIVLLTRLPLSIINGELFHNQKNKNYKNYTKLENYNTFNELQIYNTLEPEIEKPQVITTTKETKQKCMMSNCLNENNDLKSIACDQSIINHSADERVTRGKTIQLQTEKRKQLDQKIIDKFPYNTFKTPAIQLYDINKQVKFLRTFGLLYRFKCPFTSCKIKKKT